MFLLKCPHCKHNMKYQANKSLTTQRKFCVYCGKTYKVKDNILKEI